MMETERNIEQISFAERGLNSLSGIRHSHEESYELIQILEGSGVMLIRDRLYPLKKYSVFFIGAGEIHSAVPSGGSYIRNTLNISEFCLKRVRELTGGVIGKLLDTGCIVTDARSESLINGEFERIYNELKTSGECSELRILPHILSILCHLSEADTRLTGSINAKITSAMEYIEENLGEHITLDELCGRAHLSKYYFCRLFHETARMSPMNYLLARRISAAKERLLYSDMSISEIALNSGFHSFSNFSNMFKKSSGMTPSVFRRQYRLKD